MRPASKTALFGFLLLVAALVGFQLFVPPIVGLSDNGDFIRILGRFGYGPSDKSNRYSFVDHDFIPDPDYRAPGYEVMTSELLFAAPMFAMARLFHLTRIPLRAFGAMHYAAFLLVLARLFFVTRKFRAAYFIWAASVLILTDVGYVAYWNSLYSEPASCIFFLFLLAESIAICSAGELSFYTVARWTVAAILLVTAKPQNVTLCPLLVLFLLANWGRIRVRSSQIAVFASVFLVIFASAAEYRSVSQNVMRDTSYNMMFLSVLPESRHPLQDLKALGLDAALIRFKGTGAWAPQSGLYDRSAFDSLSPVLNPGRIGQFYALRPTRWWRHVTTVLPSAFGIRPEACGNFERSARRPPGMLSDSFAIWGMLHAKVNGGFARVVLIVVAGFPLIGMGFRNRLSSEARRWLDLGMFLSAGCLVSFLTAAFGDANEPVKHQFLSNLLLDSCLVFAISVGLTYLSATPRIEIHKLFAQASPR